MVISARPSLTMLGLVTLLATMVGGSVTGCGGSTKPHALPPTPHDVFADYFGEEHLDLNTWVVHGDSVSVSDGMLRIVSPEPWEAGAEGVEHFFRPRESDYLTIRGSAFFPADTLGSTSIVHVQDHWRPNDPDCYFFEFVRNRESPGDNEAYFGSKVDGAVVEHVSLGSFENGDTVHWTLTVYTDYCVAEVGDRSHTTYADVQDLGLSFHGSGSATYWDFAEVMLWDVH